MSSVPGTVIGIRVSDGVVLASEKRISYDGYILSKNTRKVHPVTNHIGIGFAGLVGDSQFLLKLLRYEARNYELQHYREIRVRSLAKLLSIILFSYKLTPMITEIVVGGVDDKGPQLYVLDPVGSLIEDKYAALGTGGSVALGIVETGYREDMSVGEAEDLAIKALTEAIERDAVSGDGIDVLTVTREGYRERQILFKQATP
jgi:proteasome beta subunit